MNWNDMWAMTVESAGQGDDLLGCAVIVFALLAVVVAWLLVETIRQDHRRYRRQQALDELAKAQREINKRLGRRQIWIWDDQAFFDSVVKDDRRVP